MDEKRIVDYFVVAGLADDPEPLEEFSDENVLKPDYKQDPITDISIIVRSLGEVAPKGYKILEFTPTGFPADLNHGSIRAPEIYLCYKRGRDKPPLTDIGVLYEGKERVMSGCEVIHSTLDGRSANVNNSNSSKTFITFRRADETAASDTLAVTDITVILGNKGEMPPHAFCRIDKNLNKGMVGSDVFICYKKSMAKKDTIAYKPAILGRYPTEDYPNLPLLESVPMFCLPLGASLECWPAKAQHPLPVFSTFVLTGASFEKVYGAAVMFYEESDQNLLKKSQKQLLGLSEEGEDDQKPSRLKSVHQNKCICLLSRWPFFDTFRKFLLYIYRIAISGPHPVPIERHISHFIHEVPFPSSQRPRILVQLNHDTISISQPEETPLPQSGASFMLLLKNLGADNCLNLLLAAMIESKILIHSLRPAVLTAVAEALANIIFPFHWQCPYIPLCPLHLSDVLSAPCPFIVGVDSRYFDLYDPPSDVTCVDLDTNTITSPEIDKKWTYKALPKKPTKVLRASLERLSDKLLDEPSIPGAAMGFGEDLGSIDQDFKKRRKLLEMETAIQEAFLRFMASIMKGYQSYLLPITRAPTAGTTDVSSLFDVGGFLKSRDKAYHKFFVQLLKTQLFSRFIEERSFVSDNDASLAFFDECVEKVEETRDEPKLIELDDTSKSERTVFVTPPEPVGLPNGATYSYNGFPKLNKDLFVPPNKPVLMTPHKQPLCPNSPMTRRTKQEIKSAQKIAQRHVNSPQLWAKCLLSHAYSLWFIHLPAYVKSVHSKTKALRTAYDVLVKMQGAKLQPPDEVCYRVLMQLCGLYQQPVLAVKVLFEMKRAGVQPNAITYGFYNKAVLESKWPSSESKAYLSWNKLRCVLQAMAQFRMNLQIKKRRLSVYSTSESDFDRISRTSTDSFIDEVDTKQEVHKPNNTEFVNDLVVPVESPNMEEKTSMGGMSDRGYSSMTLDDAKRASIIIGSQDSIDSLSKPHGTKTDKRERPISKIPVTKERPKSNSANNDKGPISRQELKFDAIDVVTSESIRRRSIVKSPRSSLGSASTLQGSTCSSAGLLMTSQTTIDESVFGDLGISRSLKSAESESEQLRKRHKSASDGGLRRAATLHEYDVKTRHYSSDLDHLQAANALSSRVALEVEKNKDSTEKGSRLLGPSIKPGHSTILESGEAGESKDSDDSGRTSEQNQAESFARPVMTLNLKDASKASSDSKKASAHILDLSPRKIESAKGLAKESEDIFSDLEGLKMSSVRPSGGGSDTSSPSHSVRTPVTENDPLGLFSSPAKLSTIQSSLSGTPDLLGLNGSEDSGISTATARSVNRTNLLIDIEPFRSPSKDRLGSADSAVSTPKTAGAGDGDTRTYTLLKTSSSASSNDTSSAGSPAGAWAPLSQSGGATPSDRGDGDPPGREDTFHKSSTTPANLEYLDRTPDGKTNAPNTPSSRRGKMLARGESFRNALSSTAKSTASFFSSRFSSRLADFKQSMSPNVSMDQGELERAEPVAETPEVGDAGKEPVEDVPKNAAPTLKKAESEEILDDNKASFRNHSDSRSLDDTLDGTPSKTRQAAVARGYAGYVTGMWESLMSLQGMLQLQGLAESLQSLSSLESFKGATLGYTTSNSTPATPNGKGPEGSGDQFVPFQDMVDRDNISISSSTIGAQKISGSVQSLPQAFYSCGMEVQICSLSRCNSCSSLLYDEEIMAGWSADDSNLNTSCQFCAAKLVPFLQILIKDFRHETKPVVTRASESLASISSANAQGNLATQPFRSMTSLKSADDALAPSDKTQTEAEPTVKENADTAADTAASLENNGGTEKLIDFSPTEPKEVKLVDISPEENADTLQKVNGVTETESSTDKETVGESEPKPSAPSEEASEHQESVDGGVLTKRKTSPIVTNQPESPSRKRAASESHAQIQSRKEQDSVSQNSQDDDKAAARKGIQMEPLTVPFLSPLVLRKEVENVFEHEGDMCVAAARFADEHPIIYWNLVWYFRRLDVVSHLPGFVLTANFTNKDQPPPKAWSSADSRHVVIKPVWDNLNMHGELGTPLYALWANAGHQSATLDALITESQECPKSVMQAIVQSIMMNDVINPIKLLLNERRKQKTQGKQRFRSMYREIMFLSLVALGKENIDCDAFDREYRLAFSQLGHRDLARLRVYDRPPNNAITWCRRILSDLEL